MDIPSVIQNLRQQRTKMVQSAVCVIIKFLHIIQSPAHDYIYRICMYGVLKLEYLLLPLGPVHFHT